MADNACSSDSNNPPSTSLPFSSSISLPQQQQQPFHYSPAMYVDPLAGTTAFYQQQQHRQQQSQSQPQSEPPPPTQTTQPTQTQSQSQQQPTQQQPHPYYLHDPLTAAALQQMHLQMHLQLQAQHPHPQPISSTAQPPPTSQEPSTHRPNTSSTLPIPPTNLRPNPPPSLAQVAPPLIPSVAHLSTATIPLASRLHSHLPLVPESQMASAYRIGRYTPAERRIRLERYREKRSQRNYSRRVKYDCRKMIADKRRRVQGRFVKREEEVALAAQQHHNGTGEGEVTDGTEDETTGGMLHSTGSGSSGQIMEPLSINGRDVAADCAVADAVGGPVGYAEHPVQALHQFR